MDFNPKLKTTTTMWKQQSVIKEGGGYNHCSSQSVTYPAIMEQGSYFLTTYVIVSNSEYIFN